MTTFHQSILCTINFLRMANERILHQKIIEDHPSDETVQQLNEKTYKL